MYQVLVKTPREKDALLRFFHDEKIEGRTKNDYNHLNKEGDKYVFVIKLGDEPPYFRCDKSFDKQFSDERLSTYPLLNNEFLSSYMYDDTPYIDKEEIEKFTRELYGDIHI